MKAGAEVLNKIFTDRMKPRKESRVTDESYRSPRIVCPYCGHVYVVDGESADEADWSCPCCGWVTPAQIEEWKGARPRERGYGVGFEIFESLEDARRRAKEWDDEIQCVEDVLASDIAGTMPDIEVEGQVEGMFDVLMEMDTYYDSDCQVYFRDGTNFKEAADDLARVLKEWADRHILTNKWRPVGVVEKDEPPDPDSCIRDQLRRVAFDRQIIPPDTVTRDDTSTVDHDTLVKVVDIEPESGAMMMTFRRKKL